MANQIKQNKITSNNSHENITLNDQDCFRFLINNANDVDLRVRYNNSNFETVTKTIQQGELVYVFERRYHDDNNFYYWEFLTTMQNNN